MHITLRANEKIYINGAVLKADRKVSLELLNDAVFLLEAHVMQEADATTPLKQLYYTVQVMLMERTERDDNRVVFGRQCDRVLRLHRDGVIAAGVAKVIDLVDRKRCFEALKVIRGLVQSDEAAEPMPLAVAS